MCCGVPVDDLGLSGGRSKVEEWGWVGFGRLYFEILASRGDGRGGGMMGCWVFLVLWRSRPGGGVSGRFGWGGGLKKVWCCR